MKIVAFIIDRLKEKSTWVTMVTLLATVAGVNLAPEQKEAIYAAGISITGAVAAFWGKDA